ncbi:FAD-dependent oxidoreductase [Telluria mixta]|uniref:FAD-dependent oxidoreductase n=1 Tax=Telluria mixta TaxID=34071 RepID=A0ABT2BYR6_9BURK|nr:FAD-dependent oxidoreductase [Telluria mixta]MCS0630280.1 FAD-dependent oxidoreductase [Telluria mixta]WEM94410.1 FAD-dependent oxidoreductase [Telluria mixta]
MKTLVHIVGSGPAGLSAARTALDAGARICLIDDNHAPGGQIWRGGPARWTDARARDAWNLLRGHPDCTVMQDAQVIGCGGSRTLLVETGGRGVPVPFERLVLCSGSRELSLPFPGWTLPGVTGAGGLQALIKGGMPVCGRRVVIAGTGPLLLATASTALRAGAHVAAIVEHQPWSRLSAFGFGLLSRHGRKFLQAASLFAELRGIPYVTGARLVEAQGEDVLRGVVVRTGDRDIDYACDFLAAGFGLVPNTDLARALGCEIVDGAIHVDDGQRTSRADIWAAGECTGIGGVDKAVAEGRIAALDALGLPPSGRDLPLRRASHAFAALLARTFAPGASLRAMCGPETIVCRCEDVTRARLLPHRDWREAKLATRVGMGPCQGKTCGAACAFLFGWSHEDARIPIMPATARALSDFAKQGEA